MKSPRPDPVLVFGVLTVLAAVAVWTVYATRFWEFVSILWHVVVLGKSV